MNKNDLLKWKDKNEKLNSSRELSLGLRIVDQFKNYGIIVKIEKNTKDFHGIIYSWQENRINYGNDNCEHYSFDGWQREIRIIE